MSTLVDNDYPNKAQRQMASSSPGISEPPSSLIPPENPSFFKVPTVLVDLPSKGLVYPVDHPLHSGVIEIKYMTAREEDILSTESFIKNGTVVDRFLQSLIVTPGVNLNDMLVGDIDALTIAARVYGYGADYEITVETPSGNRQRVFADLNKLMLNTLDDDLVKQRGVNEFEFKTPTGVLLTFKLLTQKDQQIIQADLKKFAKFNNAGSGIAASNQLKHQITSVNGDSQKSFISSFVDNYLLASDARALRKHIEIIQPGIDLSMEVIDDVSNEPFQANITIGVRFFWPDASVSE